MVMFGVNLALTIAAAILLVPAGVFCAQCIAALLPARRKANSAGVSRPRVAVLMPAHNEEAGITAALQSVMPQLIEGDRILVVADNCNDATAEIARNCGAEVVERHNVDERGKGFALDFGLRQLDRNPPEIVVVMDSDCIGGAGMIDALARQVGATARPAQAVYLLSTPPDPKPRDAISALAFLVKNLVRPSGLARVGMPCLLTGTGMAFPWKMIREARTANSNLVEDLELSLDLTLAGHAPQLCSDASITGQLPRQGKAARVQRTRWEHGYLQTALGRLPGLAIAGISRMSAEVLSVALDLSVPPLALLVMVMFTASGVAIAAALAGAAWHVPLMLVAGQSAVVLCVVAVWSKFGRGVVPAAVLLSCPLYAAGKLPIYFNFAFRRETRWIRTEREVEDDTLPTPPASATRIETIQLMDVIFHCINERQCIEYVMEELSEGRGGMLVTPNLDHLRRTTQQPFFARLVAESNIVVADGMPLVWASRLQRTPLPARVAGSDLISTMSKSAGENGRSVFLLGGDPGAAQAAADVLTSRYPSLAVSGVHCPVPGFETNPEALAEIIDVLTAARPDIIYVGLGSPKQEQLIHELREWLPKAWWLGVGYSFSFLAGHGQRAPRWMQRTGLEWAHRLWCEPRRLARRYLIEGIPFAAKLISSSAFKGLTGSARQRATARPRATTPHRPAPTAPPMPTQKVVSLAPQSFAAGLPQEWYKLRPPVVGLPRPSVVRPKRTHALRAFLLLGGAIRPTPFRSAIRRSILDMPLENGRRILTHWQQQAAELARAEGIGLLPMRVLVDNVSFAPAAALPHEACHVSVRRDNGDYRGTGGVLRDVAEEYDDDDYLLVANGAQILTAPLIDMVSALYETESDVSFVAHQDGTPSGLMLIRCAALRIISPNAYVDMKEQALPEIARRFKVTHIDHRRSTGVPLYTHQDYVNGLRWWHQHRLMQPGTHADVLTRLASRESHQSTFSIVEPGATVEPGARLHDCVVLRGAHVAQDAVAVRCVLCPGSVLKAGEAAVDQLMKPGRQPQRINRLSFLPI